MHRGLIAAGMAGSCLVIAGFAMPTLGDTSAAGACVPTISYQAGGTQTQSSSARICVGRTNEFAGEPTVGVTRDGTVLLYPAYIQHPGTSYTRASVAVSHDGGATFSLVQPVIAGTVPSHAVDLDPFMYVDPATSRIFIESNVSGNCDVLSYSDDGARTWSTTTLDGCVTFDHENLFAGPAPVGAAKPSGYPNVVYRCAYDTGMFATLHTSDACEKSLDGGTVWAPTGEPAFVYDPSGLPSRPDVDRTPYGCMDQLGHGTVGPDGTVYLPAGMCGVPEVAISHDEGATWTHSVVSTTVLSHEYPNGVTVNDTAVAVDKRGHLYALWIGRDQRAYLARSVDEGGSWSRPVEVTPPAVTATALPEVAATGDGHIALAFMGSRNAPATPPHVACTDDVGGCLEQLSADATGEVAVDPAYADVLWAGYLLVSRDADRKRPSLVGGPVTSGVFIRGICGPDACSAEKDFLDVRFGPDGSAYASYVEACSSACASAADGSNDVNTGVVARLSQTAS